MQRLTQQLEDHVNVVDSASWSNIQRNVERSGVLLQNLGAALLELGRTATSLRMGSRPVDTDVSSNPAYFISASAPNPIMVQLQVPLQSGASLGVITVGTTQNGSGISGGSRGAGFLPRNIDIRIRTGPLNSSPALNQRDPATVPQPPVANNGDGQTSIGAPVNSSSRREHEVLRVVPIRTVVAALPASVRRVPSDSSCGSIGLFYPVLARPQPVGSVNPSNQRDNQASNETVEHCNAQFPDFASG